MGSCFSTITTITAIPTAKIILPNGSLKEFSSPVPVSYVLASTGIPSCFLCNSDSLYFDQLIPAMASGVSLQLDQIYFVLPTCKLEYPLSGSEMAALAMKATSALAENSKKKMNNSRRVRIMPVEEVTICEVDGFTRIEEEKSRVVRKKVRNSKRGRMVNRANYRVRLGPIEEGEE